MEANEGPQAGIIVEEALDYGVDLGRISSVNWQSALGTVTVRVPYDGARLKDVSTEPDRHKLGELYVTPPGNEREVLPVEIETGSRLAEYIKSGKRAVLRAEYDIPEPEDTLVVVDAEVCDKEGEQLAFSDPGPFRNPLDLRISLWVPDLWSMITPDEVHELEVRLLQGDDSHQILVPYANLGSEHGKKLAQSLSALANSVGGTIFIGAEQGRVSGLPDGYATATESIGRTLLTAALRCVPPVRFAPPRYIELSKDRIIAQVEVPPASPTVHILDGMIYKRVGRDNIEGRAPESRQMPHPAVPTGAANFEDMADSEGKVVFKPAPDLIVLSAAGGIDNLELGADICALLNSTKGQGRIVIENLPVAGRSWLSRRHSTASQQIEARLDHELGHLLPELTRVPVEIMQVSGKPVAVITVLKCAAPVSMYDGEGYDWIDLSRQKMAPGVALRRYLTHMGYPDSDNSGARVRLLHAWLAQPISPPEAINPQTDKHADCPGERTQVNARVSYDNWLAGQSWQPCTFTPQPTTGGCGLKLLMPLRHHALVLDGENTVVERQPPFILEARVVIALDSLLASGAQVTRSDDSEGVGESKEAWLNHLPILRVTYLRLNLSIRLDELLQRRTKTSVFSFHIQDVNLNPALLDDLTQACADLGFRIYEVIKPAEPVGDPTILSRAIIHAASTQGYRDLVLWVVASCERTPLSRQLRYESQRIDTHQTATSDLHIEAALWGTDKDISRELARLQSALYETLSRRFPHLRTE